MSAVLRSIFILALFSMGVIARPHIANLRDSDPPQVSPRAYQFLMGDGYDVVLFGDSLTDHGRWGELLDCRVANRGIGRDTVAAAKLRANMVPLGAPIFSMVGINDLIAGRSVDAIVADYAEILSAWHGRDVVVVSVLGPDDLPIPELNAALAKLAENAGAGFLDLTPRLGFPLKNTYDGVHLDRSGYALWAGLIVDLLPDVCDTQDQ